MNNIDTIKEGNTTEVKKVQYMITYTEFGVWRILEFNLENIRLIASRGGIVKIDFI